MNSGSLRRYDVQATVAAVSAGVSIVPMLVALVSVIQRYHSELGQIIYGAKGQFLSGFLGCVLISMATSGMGFLLGWSSAGKRRNDRQTRSWIGFFLGGGVLTLNIVLLIAFYLLRLETPG